MTLVINTLKDNVCDKQMQSLLGNDIRWFDVINTANMNIQHCIGCNQCWLKTPGVCAIKDDYEKIVRKLVEAQNIWVVTDTRFGFLDYRGKQIMDRIMPMLNMNIEFRDGWMRHQLRYHTLNVGVIYQGDGDQELLQEWSERCAMNLGGKSLGVKSLNKARKEASSCM